MRKWRKHSKSSRSNPQEQIQETAASSRRDFLKTAGVTAGAVLIGEPLWSQGKPATATSRKFAFPQIDQKLMITPDQALEWASFKAQCGPTWAGSTGWKRFTDFLISKMPEVGAVDLDYVEMPYEATTGTGLPSETSFSSARPESCMWVRRSGQSSTMY